MIDSGFRRGSDIVKALMFRRRHSVIGPRDTIWTRCGWRGWRGPRNRDPHNRNRPRTGPFGMPRHHDAGCALRALAGAGDYSRLMRIHGRPRRIIANCFKEFLATFFVLSCYASGPVPRLWPLSPRSVSTSNLFTLCLKRKLAQPTIRGENHEQTPQEFLLAFLTPSLLLLTGLGHAADIKERTVKFSFVQPMDSHCGCRSAEIRRPRRSKSGGKIKVKLFPGEPSGGDVQTLCAVQGRRAGVRRRLLPGQRRVGAEVPDRTLRALGQGQVLLHLLAPSVRGWSR
jgi:hypothetical protein